jgi:transposase
MRCKHIYAVQYRYQQEQLAELTREQLDNRPKTVTPRKTYRQNWSAYNQSQTTEKAEFQKLLSLLCKGIGEPAQGCGKPRLPLEDMLFACVFKVYSTFSGRRFSTDLQSAKDKDFLSTVPHFNSVLRYFDKEMLTPYLEMLIEESSLPLTALEKDFAIDASGLSATHGFSWHYAKFEEPRLIAKRDWLKIHICTGVTTNVVTAVKVTSKYENDHSSFEPLVEETKANFNMKTVSADKAYLSNHNMNVAAMNDVVPFIAFKANSKPKKNENTVWNKMYHFYALHQEKFLKEYHKRSNVESTFSMIKSKFNGSVRAKNKTSQKNEALCKILAHNICCLIQSMNEFGVEANFWKEVTLH